MSTILNFFSRFFSSFFKKFISSRKILSDSAPIIQEPEHQISRIQCHKIDEMPGGINSFCHPAILFPESVGEGLEDVTIEQFQEGYDTHFFYTEDYSSYTEIKDGRYIIKGYVDGVNVENWLVSLLVIGEYEGLKAIVCYNFGEVPIIREEKTKGPDGLDITICYFMFTTKHKTK